MSVSLIGRLGSSAFRRSNVAVLMSLAGSRCAGPGGTPENGDRRRKAEREFTKPTQFDREFPKSLGAHVGFDVLAFSASLLRSPNVA